MKLLKLAFVSALSCTVLVSYAAGQELQQPPSLQQQSIQQPSLQPTTFTYDYYTQDDAAASPSDAPVGGCDSCGGCGSCGGAPWSLFPNDNGRGIHVHGWIDAGYSYNGLSPANPPAGSGNAPVGFNYRHDQVVLNQMYAIMEKQAVSTGCCWDFGGRVDLLYGEDYVFTDAVGLELHQDGRSKWNQGADGISAGLGRYGLAMPQAYVEAAYNDVNIKLGHFYTIIGYEVVTAPNNFFYSRAYTQLYGEPFTHTGFLASWNYTDRVTLYGGYHTGWDVLTRVGVGADHGAFLGGASWRSCDDRASLSFMITSGSELDGVTATSFSNRTMYSLVGSYQINDCWHYVIQHDNGWQINGNGRGSTASWYGLNQYLFYTINDCWKAGARFEWYNDQNGFTVPSIAGAPVGTGTAYNQITLGLNWSPNANIIVRPEIRWDWQSHHTIPDPAFDAAGGPQSSQFMFGIDAIVLF